jgi:hypothetical protein
MENIDSEDNEGPQDLVDYQEMVASCRYGMVRSKNNDERNKRTMSEAVGQEAKIVKGLDGMVQLKK